MMNKFLNCFLAIVCSCSSLFAQNAKPDAYQDSLQAIVNSDATTVKKKEAFFLLGEHLVQRNPDLAEKIANNLKANFIDKEDSIASRRNNYIFAASHRWQGDYKTALEYYKNIKDYSKKQNDSIDIAKSAHFIGSLSMFLGYNVESQNNLIEAAEIYNEIGTARQKARINTSLASFYLNVNQWEKGKEQYLKALKQFEVLQDSAGMSGVNANLGFVYTELGNYKKAEMHLMKQKALNAVFPTLREMGFHHDFLGLLRQKQNRLQEAYTEHLKALKIREGLSSTYNLCESKLRMGEVLIKLNKYSEAINHLKDIFKYDEHESLNQQHSAYKLLSNAYEKRGDFSLSLQNYKLYKTLSDSIYSNESFEIIAEKDALYNKEKKDAKISLLNKENEIVEAKASRSKSIAIISLIGFILLLLAALFLYKLYTKIKKKNQVISKALNDRELLLHETHHRVKNNLQMISSLLNLQSKYVEDKKVYEVLQNGRNRVQSMAILHKSLYTGDNLDMVNIQIYFERLINNILNSYNKTEDEIQLNIQAKNIFMNVETLIPVGLIINELATNSLKHAFPHGNIEKPQITVSMQESKENYTISVKDNGIGMNNISENDIESFGKKLIKLLCNKLKASINMSNLNGTEVTIVIPK